MLLGYLRFRYSNGIVAKNGGGGAGGGEGAGWGEGAGKGVKARVQGGGPI